MKTNTNPEAKEAKMFSISTISQFTASEAGALNGFKATCTCGLEIRSSIRSLLEADANDHLAYHSKRGQ